MTSSKPYNVYKAMLSVCIHLLIGLCLPFVLSLVYGTCVYFAYNNRLSLNNNYNIYILQIYISYVINKL